ncbi:MAG: hypothetical protein ABSC11_10270 [Smithella sp.]
MKDFRKSWERLIQKIYEVDPLVCPKCQGVMRIINFIEDQQVIRFSRIWDSGLSDQDRRQKFMTRQTANTPLLISNSNHTLLYLRQPGIYMGRLYPVITFCDYFKNHLSRAGEVCLNPG